MAADHPRVYTAAELERMASAYLVQRLGADFTIPIDVELLAERGGLDLDIRRGLQELHEVLGGVFRDADSGQLLVYIDERLADDESPRGRARYRMTVAEELAHVHLHSDAIDEVRSPSDFVALHRHPSWNEFERNAKRFAALVLMPTRRLMPEAREIYPSLVHTAGTRNKPAIKRWLCEALARRFEVSHAAMHISLGGWPASVYVHVEQALDDDLDYLP